MRAVESTRSWSEPSRWDRTSASCCESNAAMAHAPQRDDEHGGAHEAEVDDPARPAGDEELGGEEQHDEHPGGDEHADAGHP